MSGDEQWATGPAPALLRYIVLGEEGNESLMVAGHGLSVPALCDVIRHAGFGAVLEEVAPRTETYAREVHGCRRHRWLPRWVRGRWFADCLDCEYVDHYRTCRGCGFCDSDGTGTAPSRWEWTTPDGASADFNAGRSGYLPVTIVDLADVSLSVLPEEKP